MYIIKIGSFYTDEVDVTTYCETVKDADVHLKRLGFTKRSIDYYESKLSAHWACVHKVQCISELNKGDF